MVLRYGEEGDVCDIGDCFRHGTEKVWRVYPSHGENQVGTEEWFRVRWDWGYYIGKGAHVLRAYVASVEGVGYIPFADQDRALRRICLPYLLE